jgi:ectoine hydroxylase-related dioxygenase (phytanoyl-CoA dioxygenase family)
MDFEHDGWTRVATGIDAECIARLRAEAFTEGSAGTRCLLDLTEVRAAALQLKRELIASGHLPSGSIAIQAIAFDKTPATNWKVAWHQDLMFPFAAAASARGFDLPTRKDGVDFARPPRAVLEELLAVRLHLDPCGATNGPLRVSPGSHREGLIPSSACGEMAARGGEVACLAEQGEAVLMRPLLLHASSQATLPARRRVLHFVYHSGTPVAEAWHRAV